MANTPVSKITIGSDVGRKVKCSSCGKEGTTDTFVTMQNSKGVTVHLCPECKVKANKAFDDETKNLAKNLITKLMGAL